MSLCFVQTARQHMIFLNAAGDCFGRSAETGREMGEHLIKCGFVKTYQKMWRRHFNETMFNAEEADQILLYNLLVSLQVNHRCWQRSWSCVINIPFSRDDNNIRTRWWFKNWCKQSIAEWLCHIVIYNLSKFVIIWLNDGRRQIRWLFGSVIDPEWLLILFFLLLFFFLLGWLCRKT